MSFPLINNFLILDTLYENYHACKLHTIIDKKEKNLLVPPNPMAIWFQILVVTKILISTEEFYIYL